MEQFITIPQILTWIHLLFVIGLLCGFSMILMIPSNIDPAGKEKVHHLVRGLTGICLSGILLTGIASLRISHRITCLNDFFFSGYGMVVLVKFLFLGLLATVWFCPLAVGSSEESKTDVFLSPKFIKWVLFFSALSVLLGLSLRNYMS